MPQELIAAERPEMGRRRASTFRLSGWLPFSSGQRQGATRRLPGAFRDGDVCHYPKLSPLIVNQVD